MSIWSGRRKALTIIAFIAPTLIGILIFNIYPIIYNTYISITNRNQFHPNPNCGIFLTGLIEPGCWPMFRAKEETGLSTPFHIQQPFYANYATLIGGLFNSDGLIALIKVLIPLIILYLVYRLNRSISRQASPRAPSWLVWLVGILLAVAAGFLLDFAGAINTLQSSGDFFVVVFRTILYVVLCIPLFFITGLILALILNNTHIKGRAFFRGVMIIPWAASTMAIMMSLIWQFFFRDVGTVNQLLKQIGIQGTAWLENPTAAFGIIVLVNIWYSYPFFFTIIL
jgi:arabinogalactan oligomer/maltooligosaccharide transport system permease protein